MVNGATTGPFQAIAHEFHDDSIYGMTMISPDPDNDDWVSELQIDIDHIDEWIKEEDGRFRFRLCQAKLHFESVSNLSVSFAFPQSTITPLPIDRMTRSKEPVQVHGADYADFSWEIRLNDRNGGYIRFRASGYRFERIGEPVLCDEQVMPKPMRR